MPNRMIMDKSEAAGENAWTKLLTEDTSKKPEIVKSTIINNNKELNTKATAALNVEQLSTADVGAGAGVNTLPPSAGADPVADASANGEQAYNRSATYGSGINSAGGESSGSGTLLSRKESFLGSFHKQIRRSIKAVSESPGPLTR
ncbi:uncharacterized protein LOC135436287 [Drosophila montana]|uniref:uncharacterized protein LOC135436287 n=1 Tax=Drosophila montana TaxID=40370 RepID=UPI00313C5950